MAVQQHNTTSSRDEAEPADHSDIPEGLRRGATVRHTLFDEPLLATVEEVVIPEVSQYVGGHAQLRSPEWSGTRAALLENLTVVEPAPTSDDAPHA